MTQDEFFMKEAIRLSAQAVAHGNEPFGAVLVKDGEIVFTNENQIYTCSDPTYHAEAGLLRNFCSAERITDLTDYTLYSSCEPCFMCCGAMVWTKLGRLVYGASDIDLCDILGKAAGTLDELQIIVLFPCDYVLLVHTVHRADKLHSRKVRAVQLWHHCLNLSAVKHTHKRCFNNVAEVMSERNFVAAKLLSL